MKSITLRDISGNIFKASASDLKSDSRALELQESQGWSTFVRWTEFLNEKGQLHNINGPAVTGGPMKDQFWLVGKQVTPQQHADVVSQLATLDRLAPTNKKSAGPRIG